MIVDFAYEIGQEVKVKPIGMIGRVDSMSRQDVPGRILERRDALLGLDV